MPLKQKARGQGRLQKDVVVLIFLCIGKIRLNFQYIKKYIKDAKNDGDEILVFPEYTLT